MRRQRQCRPNRSCQLGSRGILFRRTPVEKGAAMRTSRFCCNALFVFSEEPCPFFEIALTRCPRIDTHASTCQEVQHGLPSQSGAHPPRVPLSSFLRFVILVAQERCSVLNDFRLAVNRSEAAGWVDEGQGNGESRSHSLHSTVKTRPRPTSSTFWLTPQTNTTSPYCLGD